MNTFGKKTGCPSSEKMVEYVRESLSTATARRLESHAADCDFCGAEMLFMRRHAPNSPSGPIRPQMSVSNALIMSQTVYQNHERRAA